jgi:hypothetical protein
LKWAVLCAFHAASPPVAFTESAKIASAVLTLFADADVAADVVVAADVDAAGGGCEAHPTAAIKIQDGDGSKSRRIPEC